MRNKTRLTALLLSCVMMLMMAACGSKSYANLAEWLADNPAFAETVEESMNQGVEDARMEFDIEDNVIIYRYFYNDKVFGVDAETDETIKQYFDSSISAQESTFTNVIDSVAEAAGIDTSNVSLRIEFYNPDEGTPGYTYTVTK